MLRKCRALVPFVFFVIAFSLCAASSPLPNGQSDCIPYILADDFEEGAMNGWESYPYTQDIGCDPGIVCQQTPTQGNSRFSLAKNVIPNDNVELDIGMTKQCLLRTTGESRLKVACFIGSDRIPDKLEILLGADDGRRYIHTIPRPVVNEWIELDLPIDRFRESKTLNEAGKGNSLEPGVVLRVVMIQTRYSLVSSVKSYSVVIDDFSLSGERSRQFIGKQPHSTYFEHYHTAVLNHHYFYGDTLSLTVAAEQGPLTVKLRNVTAQLIDSHGENRAKRVRLYDDGSHGDKTAGDGLWTNATMYWFKDDDPAGYWTVRLEGAGSTDHPVRWDLSCLVPGRRPAPSDHPRVLFNREELDRMVSTGMDSLRTVIFNRFMADCRSSIERLRPEDIVEPDDIPGSFWGSGEDIAGRYSISNDAYDRWARPVRRIANHLIHAGALLYALTGDEAAGLEAKDALLRICRFKQWNHPVMENHARYMYYPVGYLAQEAALGYDLLHPLLTEEEKILVRRALIEKSIEPTYRDGTYYNRFSSNLSNHYGVSHTGALMAAAAIYGEDPDNPWLEPYLSGILAKFKAHLDTGYLAEGSYQEPWGYHSMDAESRAMALAVIERTFGIDYSTTTNFCGSYLQPLYTGFPDGCNPTFGDSGSNHTTTQMDFCLWSAYRLRDPLAYDVILPRLRAGRGSLLDFIWYTNDIEPTKRIVDLPPSRVFPEKGIAVLKTSWDGSGAQLVFRCGPHSNHYHFDQGTFRLLYNGIDLISEAGGTDYYGNLYYQSYYIQPIGHNTLLLDSHPESQRQADFHNGIRALSMYPEITGFFTGKLQDAVEGELSCVYRGKLKRYTRSFVFVKPHYFILYDEVKAAAPHTFNWLFHAEGKGALSVQENTVSIVQPGAHLRMDVLSPVDFGHRIRSAPDREEEFIMIDIPTIMDDTHFLAVLIPSENGDSVVRETSPIKYSGWIGARVTRSSATDITLFRHRLSAPGEPVEGFSTDAGRFTVRTTSGGRREGFWVRNATYFHHVDAGTLFEASAPVSAAVSYTDGTFKLETKADAVTDVRLPLDIKPAQLIINGEKSVRFKYRDGMMTIRAPAGFSTYTAR